MLQGETGQEQGQRQTRRARCQQGTCHAAAQRHVTPGPAPGEFLPTAMCCTPAPPCAEDHSLRSDCAFRMMVLGL